MRALAIVLLVAGCSDAVGGERHLPVDDAKALIWAELWDILDKRFDAPNDTCYYATNWLAIVDEVPREQFDRLSGCEGKAGCTQSVFPADVPEGTYTVSLVAGMSPRYWCRILAHELIHVADHCLRINERELWVEHWEMAGDHPDELFDVGAVYAVELELRAMTMEMCLGV